MSKYLAIPAELRRLDIKEPLPVISNNPTSPNRWIKSEDNKWGCVLVEAKEVPQPEPHPSSPTKDDKTSLQRPHKVRHPSSPTDDHPSKPSSRYSKKQSQVDSPTSPTRPTDDPFWKPDKNRRMSKMQPAPIHLCLRMRFENFFTFSPKCPALSKPSAFQEMKRKN